MSEPDETDQARQRAGKLIYKQTLATRLTHWVWAVSLFFMAGVTFGNLNALAMQNMPHLAGVTASMVAALSALGAVTIAAPVGLTFNGTPTPMMLAALVCSSLAWLLMARLRD